LLGCGVGHGDHLDTKTITKTATLHRNPPPQRPPNARKRVSSAGVGTRLGVFSARPRRSGDRAENSNLDPPKAQIFPGIDASPGGLIPHIHRCKKGAKSVSN
jgi:hypothetical protein